MAEFSEVIRQFDRMCKAHAGCVDCHLAIKGSTKTKCSISSFIDESEYIEREVMSWAAEHPEPVYPSWYEYLTDMYPATWNMIKDKPIPADIAQKLGIEPKEGV